MRFVQAERNVFFTFRKRKFAVCGQVPRHRFRNVQLIKTGVERVVVHLHVQLVAVFFVDIRNFDGNGVRSVSHGVHNGHGVFGGKLQHRFVLCVDNGIAKHNRLRVVVIVYVYVQINSLLFFRAFFIIVIPNAHVFQNRRFVIDGERERERVFRVVRVFHDILRRRIVAVHRICVGIVHIERQIHAVLTVGKHIIIFGLNFEFHVRGNGRTAASIRFCNTVDRIGVQKFARLYVIQIIFHDARVTQQARVYRFQLRRRHIVLVFVFGIIFVITGNRRVRFLRINIVFVLVVEIHVSAHRDNVRFVEIGRERLRGENAGLDFIFFQDRRVRLVRRYFVRRIIEHIRNFPVAVERKERHGKLALYVLASRRRRKL